MPTYGRFNSNLPDIEEAVVPSSSRFSNSFDRATVEATAQLADSSIFVSSTGTRFRLEKIQDQNAPSARSGRLPLPPEDVRALNAAAVRRRPLLASSDWNCKIHKQRSSAAGEQKVNTDHGEVWGLGHVWRVGWRNTKGTNSDGL